MREHKQSRILISLLLGLILLALCLPVCAFAEDTEFSDGDEAGISLVTTVPPSVISGAGAAYQKGSASGLTFKTDDAKDNLLRVLVDGKVISPDKYTVSGEPLTITLHAAYLDTLSAGEHTIEIVTTNGSAACVFRSKPAQSSSRGSGGSGAVAWSVIMPSTATQGRAVSSAVSARPGETVTITVTPDKGWRTEAVNVKDKSGAVVPVTDNGDGTWTFTMPDSTVSVSYSFTESRDGPGGTGCPRDRTCPISRFTDASPMAWYHDGVHWALAKGIMNGIGGGRFAPDGTMTRGMFATILYRMAGEPKVTGENPFTDVEADTWYTGAVIWAAGEKIIEGYGNGKFGPNDPVTREQMVTIFRRYNGGSAAGRADLSRFSDAGQISAWARDAFAWAVSTGVISGKGDGILDPKGAATRAEVAQIVMNYDTKLG